MPSLTIPDLDDAIMHDLRKRAARNGSTPEAEAKATLKSAMREPPSHKTTLANLSERLFGDGVGMDISPYLPRREPGREPPDFS